MRSLTVWPSLWGISPASRCSDQHPREQKSIVFPGEGKGNDGTLLSNSTMSDNVHFKGASKAHHNYVLLFLWALLLEIHFMDGWTEG